MTLREHLSNPKFYNRLSKELSKSKLTNQDWEDDFHNFLLYNLETTYRDHAEVISSIKSLKSNKRKLVETSWINWKLEKEVGFIELFEDSKFSSIKLDLIEFIKKLNNKQLHFYYKELLIQFLTSKDDFATTATKCSLPVSTFRYKVQKSIEIIFIYLFKIKLNIKQFKIMSVQKIKPGFERLATLITNAEKGYPFNSNEFMPLYREATGDLDTKFVHSSGVVKQLIEKAKLVVFESPVPPVDVLEEVIDTLVDTAEFKVVELESHKLEDEADVVLGNSKDRKNRTFKIKRK